MINVIGSVLLVGGNIIFFQKKKCHENIYYCRICPYGIIFFKRKNMLILFVVFQLLHNLSLKFFAEFWIVFEQSLAGVAAL